MSVTNTSTPSLESFFETASPMPLAAPVTSALRPFSPSSGIGAAVDIDRGARHIRGVVRAQGDDQRRALFDTPRATHRDRLQRAFRAMVLLGDLEDSFQPSAG